MVIELDSAQSLSAKSFSSLKKNESGMMLFTCFSEQSMLLMGSSTYWSWGERLSLG
jgi:hypothetical protein